MQEAQACEEDLEAIPGFLQANDTGAKDELAQWGRQHFDDALTNARREVARVQDVEECRVALNAYLKAWRKGHLLVVNLPPANAPAPAPDAGPGRTATDVDASRIPTIKALSKTTVLLTVPSFAGQYRRPLITLIARHHEQLRAHTHWIIDVRGNDGGADDTYYPLLSWLMPDECNRPV